MISLIKDLKNTKNVGVKRICCANSSENIAFQKDTKQEGLFLIFEFMAQKTPQQNGQVNCKFATLFGSVQLMLYLDGVVDICKDLCKGLWAECDDTATKRRMLLQKETQTLPFANSLMKTPFNQLPLREIGVVHDAKKIQGKLKNCGVVSNLCGVL